MSESPSLLARALIPLGVLILLAVGAAIFLFFLQSQSPAVTKPMARLPAASSPVESAPLPAVTQPEATTVAVPAPAVPEPAAGETSEHAPRPAGFANAQELWSSLHGTLAASVAAVLIPEEFVRKFTIAIYGLSEGRVLAQNRPFVIPAGAFAVTKLAEDPRPQFRIQAQNADRYTVYLQALQWANTDAALQMYQQSYPQLQAAFEELGIGKRSFHQTAIIAIDNLLAAPDVTGDYVLEQPKARYTYSDPELEKLPATHKLMLRIGAKNNTEVKQLLRQLRQHLAAIKV